LVQQVLTIFALYTFVFQGVTFFANHEVSGRAAFDPINCIQASRAIVYYLPFAGEILRFWQRYEQIAVWTKCALQNTNMSKREFNG